jgi:hypothetical protein
MKKNPKQNGFFWKSTGKTLIGRNPPTSGCASAHPSTRWPSIGWWNVLFEIPHSENAGVLHNISKNTLKKGVKTQLPVGHARTLPPLRGHVTFVTSCQGRYRWRHFQSLPIRAGHVTSDRSSSLLRKCDLKTSYILLRSIWCYWIKAFQIFATIESYKCETKIGGYCCVCSGLYLWKCHCYKIQMKMFFGL